MNPYEEAAQSMMSAGIGSLSGSTINKPWESAEGFSLPTNTEKEFNKFQIRANEPDARALENYVFDTYRKQGKYPMNINTVPEGKGWRVRRPYNVKNIEPMHHLDPNKWLPNKYKERISAGITNPNLGGAKVWQAGGLGDTIRNWFKYGFGDPENQWKGNPYELDKFEFNLLHPRVDFESVLPEERTIDTEGEEYRKLHELLDQLRRKANPLEGALQGGISGDPLLYEPGMEANVPKWYKWYDKLIKRFGQEKGSQLWHQYANRGGIIGLI